MHGSFHSKANSRFKRRHGICRTTFSLLRHGIGIGIVIVIVIVIVTVTVYEHNNKRAAASSTIVIGFQ
jgi:hypothetical protein